MLDAALVAWCAAWIWMGASVAQDVRGLIELSDTVTAVGRAVDETGGVVESLDGVPLLGERVAPVGRSIAEAGRAAVESGEQSRASVRRTATLLGLSIALIPTLPVLVVYLPRRVAAVRRRRALVQALSHGRAQDVEAYLAFRALLDLPLERLPRRGKRAFDDLIAGRHRELAEAELQWLGIRSGEARREG